MLNKYYVNCLSLNLRKDPAVKRNNIITVLHQNQKVEIIQDYPNNWAQVKILKLSGYYVGCVNKKYLSPQKQSVPEFTNFKPVHLITKKPILRNYNWGRAYPLSQEEIIPLEKHVVEDYYILINHLDVEKSARYKSTKKTTYCNVYAYDFAFLLGVYIPRVWWLESAINKIKENKPIEVIYGKTVREMSANRLFDWFRNYSLFYGWHQERDLTKFQLLVNKGNPGIICAKHKNPKRSGHITFCLPEYYEDKAIYKNGVIIKPLQSQAGARNKEVFADNWFTWKRFSDYGFWVNTGGR